jgi:hypothetical protein
MRIGSARLLRTAAAVVVAGAMVLFTTTTANAGSVSHHHGSAPTVRVNVTTADGISMASHVHAGIVTFKVTQLDADYHAVQGIRLKHGAKLSTVLQEFSDALLGDAPTRAAAVNAINRDAVLIGGALTMAVAGSSIKVTVPLTRGTYYFFDYADIGVITPRVKKLHVTGHFRNAPLPQFSKVVVATMENDQPRFITPTNFSAKATFFFYNASDEAHEVMFRPTRPGITDDYITQFYNAILAGTTPPASPWTGVQAGLQPVSPNHWAVVHIDFPAGPYAEICYVPDDESGIPHAYEGMHVVVTLH